MSLLAFTCALAVAIDGDTLRCANIAQANGRVRIARIDAPERGAVGFEEARWALAGMIEGRTVRCKRVDADPRKRGHQASDPYGRIVARCEAAGRQLGPAMIALGRAQVWPRKKV